MRQNTLLDETGVFAKYIFGYTLLLLPFMAAVFDGRALVAQAKWYVSRIGLPNQIYVIAPTSAAADSVGGSAQKVSINISDYQIPDNVFQGDVRAFLVVPKIKVAAPVVFPETIDNNELLTYLERGVIKYRDSDEIGSPGTAIILGHSSAYPWYKGQYGSVFALLSQLEAGDQFFVKTKDATYIYQVSGKKIIVPEDFKLETKDSGSHILFISCWPVRSNKFRIVVSSDLVAKQ